MRHDRESIRPRREGGRDVGNDMFVVPTHDNQFHFYRATRAYEPDATCCLSKVMPGDGDVLPANIDFRLDDFWRLRVRRADR